MPTKIKTSLKEGIILAFTETKKHFLSVGDLSFLLRKEELKRYPTKKKKRLYKGWKEQLRDPITNSWKYPFKQYDITVVAIVDELKRMKKKGMIKKTKNKKYRLDNKYRVENVRIYNKISLDSYSREYIIDYDIGLELSYGKIVLYGLSSKIYNSLSDKDKDKIDKNIKNIERKIGEIETIKLNFFMNKYPNESVNSDMDEYLEDRKPISFSRYRLTYFCV